MPRSISGKLVREVPVLRADQELRSAVAAVIEAGVPALPVVDERGRPAGIFGEREFITAAFPGYLGELKYAAFVTEAAATQLELREECLAEPVRTWMNTEHVDVPADYADAQLAEIFLHHRVLVVPVVHEGAVVGVVTRSDFFRAVAERLGQDAARS